MSFAVPADLREIVLYWWKIIDRPSILLDELYNFIAFDLFLAPLDKTRAIVDKAIQDGYLIADPIQETVTLSESLNSDFQAWQKMGIEKVQRMSELITQAWRPPLEITEKSVYDILQSDIADVSVREKAGKMLASAIKVEKVDFNSEIMGYGKEENEKGEDIQYPFCINVPSRMLQHNCPEYLDLRRDQKRLCPHLVRAFTKLFISNELQTQQLIRDLVDNRESWTFK